MKTALLITTALLLAACASGPQKAARYTYNEIQVTNNSSEPVRNLTLRQPASGLSFDCGDIAAFGLCQHHFGRRPHIDGPYLVDWSFAEGPRQTTTVEVEIPSYNAIGNPLYAIFEIDQSGALSARFVQKIPG